MIRRTETRQREKEVQVERKVLLMEGIRDRFRMWFAAADGWLSTTTTTQKDVLCRVIWGERKRRTRRQVVSNTPVFIGACGFYYSEDKYIISCIKMMINYLLFNVITIEIRTQTYIKQNSLMNVNVEEEQRGRRGGRDWANLNGL